MVHADFGFGSLIVDFLLPVPRIPGDPLPGPYHGVGGALGNGFPRAMYSSAEILEQQIAGDLVAVLRIVRSYTGPSVPP